MRNRLLLIQFSVLFAKRLMHVIISIFSSQCLLQTCYCKVDSVSLHEKIYLKCNEISYLLSQNLQLSFHIKHVQKTAIRCHVIIVGYIV